MPITFLPFVGYVLYLTSIALYLSHLGSVLPTSCRLLFYLTPIARVRVSPHVGYVYPHVGYVWPRIPAPSDVYVFCLVAVTFARHSRLLVLVPHIDISVYLSHVGYIFFPDVGYVSPLAFLPAQMTAGGSSLTRGLRLEKAL